MGGIKRRELMEAATVGGITLSIAGAATRLFSNEARAQGASPPAAWPDKRLLQLLKIEHPIVQAPMGFHTSPDMAAAVCKAGGLGSFSLWQTDSGAVAGCGSQDSCPNYQAVDLNFSTPLQNEMLQWKLHGSSDWQTITPSLV